MAIFLSQSLKGNMRITWEFSYWSLISGSLDCHSRIKSARQWALRCMSHNRIQSLALGWLFELTHPVPVLSNGCSFPIFFFLPPSHIIKWRWKVNSDNNNKIFYASPGIKTNHLLGKRFVIIILIFTAVLLIVFITALFLIIWRILLILLTINLLLWKYFLYIINSSSRRITFPTVKRQV